MPKPAFCITPMFYNGNYLQSVFLDWVSAVTFCIADNPAPVLFAKMFAIIVVLFSYGHRPLSWLEYDTKTKPIRHNSCHIFFTDFFCRNQNFVTKSRYHANLF